MAGGSRYARLEGSAGARGLTHEGRAAWILCGECILESRVEPFAVKIKTIIWLANI